MTRICREAGLIKEALHVYRGMRRHAPPPPQGPAECACRQLFCGTEADAHEASPEDLREPGRARSVMLCV